MATVVFPIPATNRLAGLPTETLNAVFAHVLVDVVRTNDALASKGAITRFHSKQPPPLEIRAYLERLAKYTPFPRDAVLLAVVYLNRITHLPYTAEPDIHPAPLLAVAPPRLPPRPPAAAARPQPAPAPAGDAPTPSRLTAPTSPLEAPSPLPPSPTISSVDRPRVAPLLNSYTLHRLVLAVLLIATKFTADGTLSQTRAAKVGGVGAAELCKLEGEGLRLLGWELMWSLGELEAACAELERVAEETGLVPPEAEARRAATTSTPASGDRPPGTDPPSSPPSSSSSLPFSPPRPSFLSAAPVSTSRPTLSARSSCSTTASLSTSTASSDDASSTSYPSSSASSPQPHPHPHPHRAPHALPPRTSAPTPAHPAADAEAAAAAEDTPPSSPSAGSSPGGGTGAGCGGGKGRRSLEGGGAREGGQEEEEEEGEGGAGRTRALSPRASCETVRRLEGLQLSAA